MRTYECAWKSSSLFWKILYMLACVGLVYLMAALCAARSLAASLFWAIAQRSIWKYDLIPWEYCVTALFSPWFSVYLIWIYYREVEHIPVMATSLKRSPTKEVSVRDISRLIASLTSCPEDAVSSCHLSMPSAMYWISALSKLIERIIIHCTLKWYPSGHSEGFYSV